MNIKKLNEACGFDCIPYLDLANEFCLDGWEIDDPQPEQLAAALFMEARTQDDCVKAGESAPEHPIILRSIAYQILLQDHSMESELNDILGVEPTLQDELKNLLNDLSGDKLDSYERMATVELIKEMLNV